MAGVRMPKDLPRVTPVTATAAYACSCCGKTFVKQNGNFMQTNSPLFANNAGYLTFCKTCCEKHYDKMFALYGNEPAKAIHECCRTFGWYWNEGLYDASKKILDTYTPLVAYYITVGGKNGAPAGYTYENRIQEDVLRIENGEIDETTEVRTATTRQIKVWGKSFETEEYAILDDYYDDLTAEFKSSSPVQEKLLRDLCVQRLLQDKAIRRGDIDAYEKASKLYHSTLKAGDLEVKSKEEDLNDPNASYGHTLAMIENFTPGEYYKDKKLFLDFDKIKEYFERFILRPMKNFITGSNDRDPEYTVQVGDIDADAELEEESEDED